MKIIIAGSRDYEDWKTAFEYIQKAPFISEITELVCGMAAGVDTIGMYFAFDYNIPIKRFPANWHKLGAAAGPIRNKEMAEYADAAIIIMNNYSPGSMNMLKNMKELNKPYFLVILEDGELLAIGVEDKEVRAIDDISISTSESSSIENKS